MVHQRRPRRLQPHPNCSAPICRHRRRYPVFSIPAAATTRTKPARCAITDRPISLQLTTAHGWSASTTPDVRLLAKEDLSQFSPEKRAERDAAFRAAAKADGYDLPETVSAATVAHADKHMLPVSANEYSFDVSAISTPERSAATRSEMGEMAAELGFLPGVGSGLLARIADNAKAIKGAPPEARAQWGNAAKADMIRGLGGSEAEFDRQLAVIRDDLAQMKGKGRSLAQSLAKDVLLFDWYTFKTLYRHATAKESFYKTMPGR
jgi:hypothetical protein